ncbi:MAG: chromate transporter [Ruminococcaceae bacterium]|nr:chromate transporter [Oscillospiraceae bacterium]
MIYLQLFLTFLKVGAFAFGGGYAMLSLIGDSVLKYGWMTEEELLNFVGVETVIPGPIAVNMATYIGYEQGGFLGALLATIGVVLPSFIIILVVAACIKNLLKYPAVKTFIASMRPALGGLIVSVAVTMALTVFFGIDTISSINLSFDWRTLVVLAVVIAIPIIWKRIKKKEFSSILLVVISGVVGMFLFGI